MQQEQEPAWPPPLIDWPELDIILPDVTLEAIIREEGASHRDGSACNFWLTVSPDGLVYKCILCGGECEVQGQEPLRAYKEAGSKP